MPIIAVDFGHDPGQLVQLCAACGREHTIDLDRGAAETGREPFRVESGNTLAVAIDGGDATEVVFDAGASDATDGLSAATVASKLGELPGANATVRDGSVVLESATRGAQSRVQIVGGTARAALGLFSGEGKHPAAGRPVLGTVNQRGEVQVDVIALRQCGCGAIEYLIPSTEREPESERSRTGRFWVHRRVVNALAAHFVARGWVEQAAAEELSQVSADRWPDVVPFEPGRRMQIPPPRREH